MSQKVVTSKNNLKQYPVVASLDIHDKNIYLFTGDVLTGEILADCNILGGYRAVETILDRLNLKKKIMVICEAGGHGFAPYRYFTKSGYACTIIAPSSIPKRNKMNKTDRHDAIDNFNYHVSGLLRYVTIPGETDEDTRECLRYRYQTIWNITREKQKIQALLKRHGLKFDLTKSFWTQKHFQWLKSVQLPASTRMVLDQKLKYLDDADAHLLKIDKSLDETFEKSVSYKSLAQAYQYIPGIGRVSAMTLVLEGLDLNRFPHPNAFMNYVGLFPGKLSSSTRDPALRITKAGNRYLRYCIVGAAKYFRDRRLVFTKKQIAQLPEPVQSFTENLEDRLCSRYRNLCAAGKKSNVAKVAVARELCGFIWELAVKIFPDIKKAEIKNAA
jgi:transposase